MGFGQGSAAAIITDEDREFAFSDADFRDLAKLAYEYAGIALSDSKSNLIYSRLSRRLRALKLASFRDYRTYLTETDDEIEQFINAISTNLTKFFREIHHFQHFRENVAVPFAASPSGERLRVWSAGCSTGEEPYSIAVVLTREVRDFSKRDVRILATDIDTSVLAKGMAGRYPRSSIDEVPKAYREFLHPAGGSEIVMGDDVHSLITFARLNLIESWPFHGKFDAIFCRNVMIYFDNPTKARIVDRFTQQLKPGGFLYIGHSESLIGAHKGLELVGRTVYRREP